MARVAESAADVLPYAELTDVRVYEIAGRLTNDPIVQRESTEKRETFQVLARADKTFFETRGRLSVVTDEAEIVVDMGAVYSFSEEIQLPPAVVGEFLERVGVMALYPFVREQVFSTARRLGVAAPVLGLLRAGQFTIETETAQASQ